MIEDAHERTRAILWMLADIDPDMPVLAALGHLRAIENRLRDEAEAVPFHKDAPALMRHVSGSSRVTARARSGDIEKTALEICIQTGAELGIARSVAVTMVNLLAD